MIAQMVAETGASGLHVFGGLLFAAFVRGAWRAVKQRRANLRQLAALREEQAYALAYLEKKAAYDAHYRATLARERSTGE